tara:strand:+ start:5408 stop:5962 length:555 start_codon:yes stop_codon:yes gene_type:complete
MVITTVDLEADLIERTRVNLNKVEKIKTLSKKEIEFKENSDKWSALECIAHLNLYADFYNPVIKKSIENSNTKPNEKFKSGMIGNYFVKTIEPKKKLNKMKTPKDKDPSNLSFDLNQIEKFISQQKEFLEFIELSKNIDLTKTKTAISLTKLFKMRLGDTFRFLVAHNERHLMQAENAIKVYNQ